MKTFKVAHTAHITLLFSCSSNRRSETVNVSHSENSALINTDQITTAALTISLTSSHQLTHFTAKYSDETFKILRCNSIVTVTKNVTQQLM